MKKLLIAASLLLSTSAVALAADAVVYEPVPAAAVVPTGFVWTGGYVGLQAGYAWGKGHYASAVDDSSFDVKPDGFIGGVYAGYNYQAPNNFVFGIDGDVTYANAKDTFTLTDDGDTASFKQDLRWSGAVRGRVGYAADRFMPYVAGGVAFGGVRTTFSDEDGSTVIGDKTHVGWTVGAGVEYAFTDNVIGRVEYRYTDFGKKDYPEGADNDAFSAKLRTHDLRVGVGFKF